jgi:bacillithiol system protein YtxJ
MFTWRGKPEKQPDVPEARLPTLARMREDEVAVVFKHSPSCAISWAAEAQVKKFVANHPSVPVYTILVRQDRELSRQIAELTGIRHESPQVIVLRRGVVVADASHQDVTADFLACAINHCVGSK